MDCALTPPKLDDAFERSSMQRMGVRTTDKSGASGAEKAGSGRGGRSPDFRAEGVTLFCGDCADIVPELCGVAAVITDPPYGIEADKGKAHSSIRDNERWPASEWDKQRPPDEMLRSLPGLAAIVAVWGGNYFADCLPPSGGWLIWRKPQAETGFSLADAEMCWTSLSFAARMRTIPRRDGNEHPTQKPVLVMAWTMEQLKVPAGATVLDPYMGSGTTGIACIRTGRPFIGIERDPNHFATAVARIRRELAQGDLFLGGGGAELVGDENGESESRAGSHTDEALRQEPRQ